MDGFVSLQQSCCMTLDAASEPHRGLMDLEQSHHHHEKAISSGGLRVIGSSPEAVSPHPQPCLSHSSTSKDHSSVQQYLVKQRSRCPHCLRREYPDWFSGGDLRAKRKSTSDARKVTACHSLLPSVLAPCIRFRMAKAHIPHACLIACHIHIPHLEKTTIANAATAVPEVMNGMLLDIAVSRSSAKLHSHTRRDRSLVGTSSNVRSGSSRS
eukprot:1862360-Amphidinium_carterae.1